MPAVLLSSSPPGLNSGDEGTDAAGNEFYDVHLAQFPAADPWATASGGTTTAIGANGKVLADYPFGETTDETDDAGTGYDQPLPGDFSIGSPPVSSTRTAWLSFAQSMPAVTARVGSGVFCTLIVASALSYQWGSTRRFRDTTAGCSLSGVRTRIALWPIGASRAAGPRRTHAGPRRSREQGDGPTVTGALEPTSARVRQGCTNEHGVRPELRRGEREQQVRDREGGRHLQATVIAADQGGQLAGAAAQKNDRPPDRSPIRAAASGAHLLDMGPPLPGSGLSSAPPDRIRNGRGGPTGDELEGVLIG
jgi:hypothetical protein